MHVEALTPAHIALSTVGVPKDYMKLHLLFFCFVTQVLLVVLTLLLEKKFKSNILKFWRNNVKV